MCSHAVHVWAPCACVYTCGAYVIAAHFKFCYSVYRCNIFTCYQADEDREQRRLKKLEAQKIRQQKIAEEVYICTVLFLHLSSHVIS